VKTDCGAGSENGKSMRVEEEEPAQRSRFLAGRGHSCPHRCARWRGKQTRMSRSYKRSRVRDATETVDIAVGERIRRRGGAETRACVQIGCQRCRRNLGWQPKGSNRVNRGGSWNNNAINCRAANRNNNNPTNRNNNLGFRSVLPPAQPGCRKAAGLTRRPSCPRPQCCRGKDTSKSRPVPVG